MTAADLCWYAVRCVFLTAAFSTDEQQTYEERITLWQATSDDAAIAFAEDEAQDYASTIPDAPDTYLGLAQSYKLVEEPGHAAEVFSLMRTSRLAPEQYLRDFFDNGDERQERG